MKQWVQGSLEQGLLSQCLEGSKSAVRRNRLCPVLVNDPMDWLLDNALTRGIATTDGSTRCVCKSLQLLLTLTCPILNLHTHTHSKTPHRNLEWTFPSL